MGAILPVPGVLLPGFFTSQIRPSTRTRFASIGVTKRAKLPGEGRAYGISNESNTCRWSPGYPTAEGYGLLLTHNFVVNRLRARLIQGTPLAPCRSTRRFGERASYYRAKRNVYARFERFRRIFRGRYASHFRGLRFFCGVLKKVSDAATFVRALG